MCYNYLRIKVSDLYENAFCYWNACEMNFVQEKRSYMNFGLLFSLNCLIKFIFDFMANIFLFVFSCLKCMFYKKFLIFFLS